MALIPQDILEDVRLKNDIVEIVGEYVRLEKRGRNYIGSCPFHQERDPSFSVSPEKQIFYCFGCQTGGNVFKFLMLIENLTFIESVKRLAERSGIILPDTGKITGNKQAYLEERAWQANALARDFYHHYLLTSPHAELARQYLASRGISGETIRTFKIGYAPDSWDSLVKFFGQRDFQNQELLNIGLAMGNPNRLYDRFRNRIIFPVTNHHDKVVAFGGRILEKNGGGNNQPKYLNTPETPFFHKSKVLFGLNLAKKHIRTYGYAVLMEGYMDVVTAHQHGIRNALASMGTSLTYEQGNILMRYSRDIYIAYDADSAGQKAASRGLDILQETGCSLKVINMPEGFDPDDFIRQYGLEGWEEAVDSAESLLEYKIRLAQKEIASSAEILNDIMPNLATIKNQVELEESIRLVASRLNISWDSIKSEIRRFKDIQRKKRTKTVKITKNKHNSILQSNIQKDAVNMAEQGILRILIKDPGRIDFFKSQIGNDIFQEPVHQELCRLVTEQAQQGNYDPAVLLNELEGAAAALFSRLAMEDSFVSESPGDLEFIPAQDDERVVADYINVIKNSRQAKKRMLLMQELAEAEKNNNLELVKEILLKIQNI